MRRNVGFFLLRKWCWKMSCPSERPSDSQRGHHYVEDDFFSILSHLKFCTLLGCYTAYNCNSLPTFRDNLTVPSFRVKKSKNLILDLLTLEGGNYQSAMILIPEEHRSFLPRGRSMKNNVTCDWVERVCILKCSAVRCKFCWSQSCLFWGRYWTFLWKYYRLL